MRIDWQRETFESGLVELTTTFRGFDVMIRQEPSQPVGWWHTVISTGDMQHYMSFEEINESTAMTQTLRWINHYWDLLEDGEVEYEAIDTSSLQPEAEETFTECPGEPGCACDPKVVE